jgi:glycyl-tRNA synthetase beta chain
VTGADPVKVDRAVVLAKADLRTEAVGEFPELQGIMGHKYAALQGEDAEVAAAIEEHYKPQGPTDSLPTNKIAITVALADKLDTLVGFWAIDEKPTGSKDPYALRRAALGVIRILLEKGVRIKVLAKIHTWYKNPDGVSFSKNPDDVEYESSSDLLSFFHDRLKVYLRDLGARHDIIDAVLTPDAADLLMVARRAEALTAFITSEDGLNLLAGTKRATQLLAAEEKKGTRVAASVDEDLFTEEAEKALFTAISLSSVEASEAVKREDFGGAMKALSKLRAPVDRFFTDVLVNDEDQAIRANRLALLVLIRQATATVADFSKIAG